jgi:hypothetical protein
MVAEMGEELKRAHAKLMAISEELAGHRYGDGAWTRKQLLGHLIDSATNNRYQIVKTLVDGSYTGPSYDQESWVRVHDYAALGWNELVELWWAQNRLLAQVVGGIAEDQWGWKCAVGSSEDGTLRDRVDDYRGHLAHHLGQM